MLASKCDKLRWCSGNINAFQAFALGSIPGRSNSDYFFCLFRPQLPHNPNRACIFGRLLGGYRHKETEGATGTDREMNRHYLGC